jgi:hypothetical protein
MESKQEATQMLVKWKILYFISLITPIVFFALYLSYSLTFTPDTRNILINNYNAIYQSEDLSKSNITEGKLKQIVYETLRDTFTFNYLSFSKRDDYLLLLSKEKPSDIPDHRDKIRSLYSKTSHKYVIENLYKGDWVTRLHSQRRRVFPLVSTPPVRESITSDWIVSEDSRLNAKYSGYLYIVSESKNFSVQRYRIDYRVVMERKPNAVIVDMPDYFFAPMVKPNTE